MLNQEKVTILGGFIKNIILVLRYFQTVYANEEKQGVLCGINLWKIRAGKTGFPLGDHLPHPNYYSIANQQDKYRGFMQVEFQAL